MVGWRLVGWSGLKKAGTGDRAGWWGCGARAAGARTKTLGQFVAPQVVLAEADGVPVVLEARDTP